MNNVWTLRVPFFHRHLMILMRKGEPSSLVNRDVAELLPILVLLLIIILSLYSLFLIHAFARL